MRQRFCGSSRRAVACLVPAALVVAAAVAACSGSGSTANTAAPAPTVTPTGSATTPGTTPAPTVAPTTGPTPRPSPSATTGALFTAGCQVGSNYIDFQNASQAYVPAPGYGQLTVGTNIGQFSSLGITAGETGQIQSLNEGAGTVTLPSAFVIFNGSGSQNQLIANDIPPGQVGPFNVVDNGNGTSTVTFSVDGYVSDEAGVGFQIFFSATFPYPAAVLFANLPLDGTCVATSGQLEPTSKRARPLSRH